jgi:hypothetical protein
LGSEFSVLNSGVSIGASFIVGKPDKEISQTIALQKYQPKKSDRTAKLNAIPHFPSRRDRGIFPGAKGQKTKD